MKRALLLVLAGLPALGLLLPLFAGASHVDVVDSQDARGPLDVGRVNVLGTDKPRWKVMTHRGWRARDTWDKGYVMVFLDTFGNDRFDYYVLVSSTGNRMRADLYRDRQKKRDRRIRKVKVWRKNRTSVSVRVPLPRLKFGEARAHYRWYVQTLFTGRRCKQVCFDRAPDAEAIVEPRPGFEPTPTPTPTETSTPDPS